MTVSYFVYSIHLVATEPWVIFTDYSFYSLYYIATHLDSKFYLHGQQRTKINHSGYNLNLPGQLLISELQDIVFTSIIM